MAPVLLADALLGTRPSALAGGEILVEMLERAGIRQFFTLHGGHLDSVFMAAQERGFFRAYTEHVFSNFFDHRLEIDDVDEIADAIEKLGDSAEDYRKFADGEGATAFERCIEEAHEDQIFGVPIFVYSGELFWGQDRIPLLEERLHSLRK